MRPIAQAPGRGQRPHHPFMSAIPRRQFALSCLSCGAPQENSIVCTECGPETVAGYEQNGSDSHHEAIMNQAEQVTDSKPVRKSTLIEFPGLHRNSVP